ncbi:MAG TPA: DMT family transporter [Acidisarcina sp.]|nr:DMT family transporter [Acidisarcina sp.]
MLGVVFIWGCTFVLVKNALTDISPLLFNLLRMLLATICLALVYRRHLRGLTRRAWWSGMLVGACLAIGYQFQTAGLKLTTPSKSAFLTGMVVVMVPLLSAVPWLRAGGAHAPRWNVWIGALLAFAGIVLLTSPPSSGHRLVSDFAAINLGDVLSIFCALGFALHVIALSHTSPRIPFQQLAVLQIGFCTLFMALSMPLFEHPWMHLTSRLVLAIVLAAVLATAAAFTIQSWAQKYLPATHTALILTLEPVFASMTSFVFLHERLGLRGSIGAILILGAIGLTELIPTPIQPTAHEGVPLEERGSL